MVEKKHKQLGTEAGNTDVQQESVPRVDSTPIGSTLNRRTFFKLSALAGSVALAGAATRSTSVERVLIDRARCRPGMTLTLTVAGQWSDDAHVLILDAHEGLGEVLARIKLIQHDQEHWRGTWTVPDGLRTAFTGSTRRIVAGVVEQEGLVVSGPTEVILTPLGFC